LLLEVFDNGKKRTMMPQPASPAIYPARIVEVKEQLAAGQWKVELAKLKLETWEAEHQLMPLALSLSELRPGRCCILDRMPLSSLLDFY